MKTFLKSRGLLLLLSLAMMPFCAKAQVSVWDGTYTPWTKGTGTATDPFLIENASQLAYLAVRVNNGLDDNGNHISNPNLHYKLMVDVDLNSNNLLQWTPIGYRSSNIDYQLFGGHFDGNNHMVSGLYIRSADTCVGFFGCIYGAVVENLGINGVVSSNHESSIVSAGIIIGNARHSLVKNCYSMGNVYSNGSTGGIIGFAMEDTITNCYNTANVLSNYSCSGGIIGSLSGTDTSIVINCYNTGQISNPNVVVFWDIIRVEE